MKKVIMLSFVAAIMLIGAGSSNALIIADSVAGFSSTQGANGWNYYGKHFAATNWTAMTYNAPTQEWYYYVAGSQVLINSTSQSKTEGNAYFSLRSWTSSADYTNVTVDCQYSTVSSGAFLRLYTASNGVTADLAGTWGTQSGTWSFQIPSLAVGDKIMTYVQNDGSGTNSGAYSQMITTVSVVPEPCTMGLLGLGLLGLRSRNKK